MRLIDADKLLAEYDRQHEGQPGKARELIENAPTVHPEPKMFHVVDSKTGKDADVYDIALHEEWAQRLCFTDMEGWALEEDGTLLLLDECGNWEYASRERFKVMWDD